MPLSPKSVGQTTEPLTHAVDARWVMAYAAGLGDRNPRYLDTTRAVPVVAHPLFPVCLEWPVILAARSLAGSETTTPAEGARSVHASHDLHIQRLVRAGDVLRTTATVIGLEARTPGAFQTLRLDTHDERDELVCRTYQLGISRGVAVTGEAKVEQAPAWPAAEDLTPSDLRVEIPVSAEAAHIYTECARIWNPIHTDRAVALSAGLPDIILHGTATLALALTALVDRVLGGEPGRVRRLGGQFAAMVPMPSTIALVVTGKGEDSLAFEVRTEDGQPAIRGGFLMFDAD